MAEDHFGRTEGSWLDVFLKVAVYPMCCMSFISATAPVFDEILCVLTMTDVRNYDVEVPFMDGWISRKRKALRDNGDDGGSDLRATVIRD